MSNAPLLSTSRCKSFRVSSIISPWLYLVAGLLSIITVVFCVTGIRNSCARSDSQVSVLVPVSAAMYSASVDECVTVSCLAEAQSMGCPDTRIINPVTDLLVSVSAA
eukprot:Plantae.Rhodophyta-Palmaria_palmata.ctg5014.p2 GENE.Plantae.Rhodophyta-Palmaria_palmata.ctg5014~~Plantae.Rhodophyta-Palmaria_palmata.ctg5014.p2  ORF type:complete len:107 (-),score=5.35 Plantae.Rhodophyta-Palmaria_palmata.ctg5014:71-391(-)